MTFRKLGTLQLKTPDITPELAGETAQRLKDAQPALLALKTEAILRAIDEAVVEWLAPGSEARHAAEEAFCASTGLPAATAPFTPLLEACRGGHVREWVRAEISPFEALEGFVAATDGVLTRALGPRLAVHVLPGNVPAVWLPALLACVVMRTPCLLKPAADDPLTPALFVATLVRKLPPLAEGLAVLPWTSGDEAVERAALRDAEAVIVYGGDTAVRSLAHRVPPEARWLAHGPRFAAGAIGREAAGPGRLDPVVAAAARDALLYDGRGCLSLAVIFVESGGLYEPREVAGQLARALEKASADLPPGRPDRGTAALTQSWRARLKARALAGKPAALFASAKGLDWTLCYDEELPPPMVPLTRTVWVNPVRGLDELPARLAPAGLRMHALAFAGSEARRLDLAGKLAPLGLTRLTVFGELQTPPLAWPHGGTSPFKQLLHWVRLEH